MFIFLKNGVQYWKVLYCTVACAYTVQIPGAAAVFERQPAVEVAAVLRGAEAGEHVAVAPEHDEHDERDAAGHAEHNEDHAPELEVAACTSFRLTKCTSVSHNNLMCINTYSAGQQPLHTE